jgi:hypothetical protein
VFLDYRYDERWLKRAPTVDVFKLSRVDLSTWVMTGDQIFLIDGRDFSYVGYGIPLLEFARSLVLSIIDLERGAESASSNPLDVEDRINFVRDAGVVTVSAELSGESAKVPLTDLGIVVRAYARRLLLDFIASHPKAEQTRELWEWYPVREVGV